MLGKVKYMHEERVDPGFDNCDIDGLMKKLPYHERADVLKKLSNFFTTKTVFKEKCLETGLDDVFQIWHF